MKPTANHADHVLAVGDHVAHDALHAAGLGAVHARGTSPVCGSKTPKMPWSCHRYRWPRYSQLREPGRLVDGRCSPRPSRGRRRHGWYARIVALAGATGSSKPTS